MKEVTKDKVCYSMCGRNAPQLRVRPGETFCIETEDCYSGKLRTEQDRFTKDMWDTVNPATGPVFIETAAPGDVLCIRIERIETRDFAVMCVENGAGAMPDRIEGVETTILPIRDGKLVISDRLAPAVRPMIGVIGLAPAAGPVLNGTPGEHGGNMDCKEIGAGSAVYLPVAVEGGLLAVGDLHALMGDGEVCICGAEVSGRVTASARRLAGCELPTPCVETAEDVMFIGSAKTLDDCEAMVLDKAHRFLTRLVGLGANEAARMMSLVGQLGVCQTVDPLKTMKFALPKIVLAALDAEGRLAGVLESVD